MCVYYIYIFFTIYCCCTQNSFVNVFQIGLNCLCADQLPARVQSQTQSFVVNTDSCDREGTHWVVFHFPKEGPAEFFDSLGRAPETYHPCFRSVLIANGPQYKFNTVRVHPEDDDTCGLYCVHFVKYRYRNFTLEDIEKEFSARNPETIEAELRDIDERILCTTIYCE